MKHINDIITSRSNSFVKWACTLSEKKGRNAACAFMTEGIKLLVEALESRLPITHIIINEDNEENVYEKIAPYTSDPCFEKTELITVSDSVFEKISTEKAPQGVICVIKHLDFFNRIDIIYKEEFFLKRGERALALCSVRDPLNLGAVIRSAAAFGTEHLILSDDCADVYNPKTVRSAMGSLFKVKITRVSSLSNFVDAARFSGRRVLSAELNPNALPLENAHLDSDDIIVIGNEGHGVSAEVSAKCTDSVYIPISDKAESLNASVAAAIIMWEQRKK